MLIRCVELVDLADARAYQRAAGDGVEPRGAAEPCRRSARLPRPRLVHIRVVQDVAGVPDFHQQSVRDRRGPLGLGDVIQDRFAITRRLFREDRQPFLTAPDDLVDLPLVIPLVCDGELVARRRLPGASRHEAVDPGVVDARRAVVLECVRNLHECCLMTDRAEPPQLVLDDGSARRAVEVVEMLDPRAARQPPRLQGVVEIGRLQMPVVGGSSEET